MEDPAAMRRRLRVELKRLRTAADMTQRGVAAALDWSPSKIIRIESGQVGITVTDLQALLRHYGVVDEGVVRGLIELARGSKKQPFAEYRDVLTAETIKFFGYESSASRIRQVQPNLVPGLLQTEEYTKALLEGYGRSQADLTRTIDSRRERQEVLDREPPPELRMIVDEAVLRRVVGGVGVMRNQLRRMLEFSARAHVSIQVVPFEAGAYEALRGPFVHLEFPDPSDPDVLYLEYSRGPSTFSDDPADTSLYHERFLGLEDLAAPADQFSHYVEKALDSFPGD